MLFGKEQVSFMMCSQMVYATIKFCAVLMRGPKWENKL